MGEFVDVTLSRVPAGFDFDDPLRLLFEWVEDRGYIATGHDGDLCGSLNDGDRRGTQVELRGHTAEQTVEYVRAWFGDVDEDPVNGPYRDWLVATFGVTIPATAMEIVREPAEMRDPATADPFCRWVNRLQEERWSPRSA